MHGDEELSNFLDHLNSISKHIKVTMEVQGNINILFLDILIIRNEDGSLGNKVFIKKTHSNNYLHADSHHHATQKWGYSTIFSQDL